MAGYSKTPLVKKLGIKENFTIKLYNQPNNYFDLLQALPRSIEFINKGNSNAVDFIHYFIMDLVEFNKDLPELQKRIKQNGMIWISWDKTKSKKVGFANENLVRQNALSLDLVDVKVCAVDETWSGLKLVIRKEKRLHYEQSDTSKNDEQI